MIEFGVVSASPSDSSQCTITIQHMVVQAKVFTVPDPVATVAHPMLDDLQKAVPSKVYAKVGSLLMQLLHPDLSKRATVQQALASNLFATGV